MDMAGKTAYKLGLCSESVSREITSALTSLGFPLECPYPVKQLYNVMLQDKKRRGNTIDLILPYSVGDCRIYPVQIEGLRKILLSL